MTRIYLLAIGIGTLALAGMLLVVGMARPTPRTAARPGAVVVPLAVERGEPRDSFWTLTSSAGMAYQREGAYDLALTGLSPTVMRRSERPDLDAMLMPTATFAGRWADWFDATGAANGTLSFAGSDGTMRSVVVEVSAPAFDGANGTLALRATLIDPVVDSYPIDGVPDLSLPESFTSAVLTLDGDAAFTHAIGPVTIAAQPAADNTVAVEVRLADAVVASQVLTPVFPLLTLEARSQAGMVDGTLVAHYEEGRADVTLDAAPLIWAAAGEVATEYRGTLGSW